MRVRRRRFAAAAAVVAGVACALAAGCADPPTAPPSVVTGGGDVGRGKAAIEAHGCVACHVIPGIEQAQDSWVAPPLMRYARRGYVAGVVVNNEENLVRWIMDPKAVNPGTAMPDLGVTELEARDIVAYLYSLD